MSTATASTPRGAARDRILDTASLLFYREGIHAVGVDAIIAQSGVAKMTFYRHFKSKEMLVVAFLRRRDERWRRWLAETVARLAPTPRERPLAIFDALAERFAAPDYRGCAFINATAEVADRQSPVYQAVVEHKHAVQEYVCCLLAAAQVDEPTVLAAQFMVLIDGALVAGYREGPAAAHAARVIAATLIARQGAAQQVHGGSER
jgi:AcrR family transcriptional regulator